MEKLTIKPWQVMQAHENGANIEIKSKKNTEYYNHYNPLWNFNDCDYRISNLTADGMRLDELVEKFPESVTLENTEHFSGDHKTHELIKALIEKPLFISEIKVKQEKKLRPWTMGEFKQYRDEWFVAKGADVQYKVGSISKGRVIMGNVPISFEEMMNQLTLEDGSPCGVIE